MLDWFFPEDGMAMAFFTAWVNPSHQTQDCRWANMKLNWWFSKNSDVESRTIKSYPKEIKQQDQNDSKIAPKILNLLGRILYLWSVWGPGLCNRTLCNYVTNIAWDYCLSLLLFNPSNCDRLPMSKMHLSSFHWSAYLTAPDTDGIYGGGSLGTRTDVFKALFVTADADKGNWPSSDMSVGPIIHIEEKKLSGIWRPLEASSTNYNSSRPDEVTMLLNNVSIHHFDGICCKL